MALRHVGGIAEGVRTLPEILKDYGYNTTCIGFRGNAASRGFDTYIDFEDGGASDDGRAHKAESDAVALPGRKITQEGKPFMLFESIWIRIRHICRLNHSTRCLSGR